MAVEGTFPFETVPFDSRVNGQNQMELSPKRTNRKKGYFCIDIKTNERSFFCLPYYCKRQIRKRTVFLR